LEVEDNQFQQNQLSLAQCTELVSFTEVCPLHKTLNRVPLA